MITLRSSNIDLKEIKNALTYKIKHTYLEKYIEPPKINEGKWMVLSFVVNQTSLPVETKKQYMITTMLIQMALDTHDTVISTNKDNETESAIVSRQLAVLAGDYYSGLYYLLLAELEDIEMIQILATTIKEISELKMKLYYKEYDSFKEYLQLITKVESLLIIRVTSFVNQSISNEMIEKIITVNKLIQERQNFIHHDGSSILSNWLIHDSTVLHTVDSMIQQNMKQVEAYLSTPSLNLSVFKTEMKQMLGELIYQYTTVAEEG